MIKGDKEAAGLRAEPRPPRSFKLQARLGLAYIGPSLAGLTASGRAGTSLILKTQKRHEDDQWTSGVPSWRRYDRSSLLDDGQYKMCQHQEKYIKLFGLYKAVIKPKKTKS